jgi:hypothetical protein
MQAQSTPSAQPAKTSVCKTGRFQFGLRAMAGAAQFNTSEFVKRSAIFSYGYGLTGEYAFSKNLSLQTGLEIVTKWSTLHYLEIDYIEDDQKTAVYLELPVMLKYTWKHVFCSTGPFIARGIGGHVTNLHADPANTPNPIKWGDLYEDDLRRTDFGLRLEIGLRFGHFRVGTTFDQGMRNLVPVPRRSYRYVDYRTGAGGIWCGWVF